MFVHREKCDVCGCKDHKILLSKPFVDSSVWDFLEKYYEGRIEKGDLEGGKYEIAKCSKCGFMWQVEILGDDLMDKLYGHWISSEKSLEKQQNDDDTLVVYKGEVATLITLLNKAPEDVAVLDFGMGWGYWALTAKEFGCSSYGFEVSTERIEFARGNDVEVIDDFAKIHEKNYDFINAEQVFEHINDPLGTLKSLVGSLKDGGIVRLSVPDARGLTRKLKNPKWKASKDSAHPLEHVNSFTHKTLKELAKQAGLKFMKQPRIENFHPGLKSYIKSLLGKHYRQRFGTTLYFQK